MHVVAISSWREEETPELVQALARTLGIIAFEARQRMIGNGPAVVASCPEPEPAHALAKNLNQVGFATLVIAAAVADSVKVRRFQFNPNSLHIETREGKQEEIPYDEIDLLLSVASTVCTSQTKKFTERKLSVAKTLIAGGIPMRSKVKHQQKITTEEHEKLLYLFRPKGAPVVCSLNGMLYDGLGEDMKMSRELNFSFLISELRRLCPGAGYDDRLVNRFAQVRLLGPTLKPEANLDLATEILAQHLRQQRPGSL